MKPVSEPNTISVFNKKVAINNMEKNAAALFMVVLAMLCSGCGGGDGSSAIAGGPTPPPTAATKPATDYTKFQVAYPANLGSSFWESPIVRDESVLPITGKTNYVLLRDIVGPVTVRNRQTGQTYTQGTDFTVNGGELVIPDGSQIPKVAADWTSTAIPGWPYTAERADGSSIRISHDYQLHQVSVTYQAAAYGGKIALSPGMPKLIEKLKSGEKVAITYVGDSITYGSDTTWEMNVEPRQHGYAEIVASHLATIYPNQVYFRNSAVAGTQSISGANNAAYLVGDTPSDLVVIAYGMNDSAASVTGLNFEKNLRNIIAAARTENQNCEILIVLSWPSNPENYPQNWDGFTWYEAAAKNIQSTEPGIYIADVTSPSRDFILQRKSFYDITSNGINHPSDWMHQFYAQVVLGTIQGTLVPN